MASSPVETNYAQIPPCLRSRPQWVVWMWGQDENGKPTKLPVHPSDLYVVNAYAPQNWIAYPDACKYAAGNPKLAGIGWSFSRADPFCGIDLDRSLDENMQPLPWAQAILDRFDTYYEISPSRTGVKIWAKGKSPDVKGRKEPYQNGAVEIYDHNRFFTATGWVMPNANPEIRDCQAAIDWLFAEAIGETSQSKVAAAPPQESESRTDITDQDIIAFLCREKNGLGFRLWRGITKDYAGDDSRADLALCLKLAYYTGRDENRIDALFRQSKLCREKWERADYRGSTIGKALERVTGRFEANNGQHPSPDLPNEPERAKNDRNTLGAILEDTVSGRRANVSFRWHSLSVLSRAMMPGAMAVLCGGAGSTKSMFVSDCCLDWLEQEIPFSVFHLEEDRAFHQLRALAQLSGNSNITLDDWCRDNPDAVRESHLMHKPTLDALGDRIWDAPSKAITLAELADWVRDRCRNDKSRVVVVDPVTAADPGGDQWTADRNFVMNCKTLMRDYEASMIIVTHPRSAVTKGDRLDQIAGGRAYNRFPSSVFWLESQPVADMEVRSAMGNCVQPVNRIIKIWKARNGPGAGSSIGFYFDPKTLRFEEQGVIVED